MGKAAFLALLASAISIAGCAHHLAGGWRITAECPAQSPFGERQINATANVEEKGQGLFQGVVKNDIGQTGHFQGRIAGDRMQVQIAWENAGTTEAMLVFAPASRSFKGLDSNLCMLDVVRP